MDILVLASVPAGGATITYNKGCAGINNAGAGLNDITLNNAADAAECAIFATTQGAAASNCTATHVSDTVKRVSTFIDDAVSGVPVASNLVPFSFMVAR